MLMPSIYGENLLDDFFDDFPFFNVPDIKRTEKKLYGRKANHIMCTDIKEEDDAYELCMDLPGFTKDEVKISLADGYLNIEASKCVDNTKCKEENEKYIRKERYAGSCCRSFYVGNQITEEEIKAEFKHGILTLKIPKKEKESSVPEKKYIAIEG